jgi:hypothetical protein
MEKKFMTAPTSSRNQHPTKTAFDKEQLNELKVKAGLKPYQSRTRLQQKDGKTLGIALWQTPSPVTLVFQNKGGIWYWQTANGAPDKGDAISFIRRYPPALTQRYRVQ